MRFEIAVDDGPLELTSAGGNVTGQIHVVLDGEPFPDTAWWDFPCVVFGWKGYVPLGVRQRDAPATVSGTRWRTDERHVSRRASLPAA